MKLSEIIAAYERGEVIEFLQPSPHGCWAKRDISSEQIHWVDEMCNRDFLRIQPTLKQIDLSVLAGQQVLCEFWNTANLPTHIYTLDAIIEDKGCGKYVSVGHPWHHCRPLFNYPQVYTGQTFPEGVVVEWAIKGNNGDWQWSTTQYGYPQAFLIKKIKEGYTL